MAYEKQTFKDNKPLYAAQLEHIEEGILANERAIAGKAAIDNSSVGEDAWSSNHIIEKICPIIDENGSLVQCMPVAGYPLSVVTEFAAVQEGSGDPSPDNERPIIVSSILGMGLWTGKNLYRYDRDNIVPGYVSSGGSYSYQTTNYYLTKQIPISHLRGKTITLNPRPGGGAPAMAFFDDADVGIAGAGGKGLALTVPYNASFMRFSINRDVVADEVDGETVLKENADVQIQLEIGSTVTDYEPFKEQKLFSVELPKGAARGIYDWNTGLLTVTHRMVDMSTLDWCFSEANATWQAELDDCQLAPSGGFTEGAICNVYATTTEDTYYSGTIRIMREWDASGREWCCVDVCDNEHGYAEEAKENFVAYLSELGAMLVYPLEVPYTVQYDPQQVLALEGTNFLAGGSGNTKVVGRSDPAALINSLVSRVAALEAAAVNNT